MKAFLKANKGRTVLLQCWGFAVRGRLDSVKRDGVSLSGVQILDETAREQRWTPFDGDLAISANQIRYAQVA